VLLANLRVDCFTFHSLLVVVSWFGFSCAPSHSCLGRCFTVQRRICAPSFTSTLVAVSRCSVGHGFAPRAPGPSGKRLRYSKFGEAAELAALRQTPPLIPNFSVPRARRSDGGANPWPTLHREYWLGELLR
jgi:hypothetical protein